MRKPFFVVSIIAYLLAQPITLFAQNKFLSQIGKTDSISSTILKEKRKFWVQLPQNFSSKKNYPVVYVLDGETHLPTVSIVQNYYSGGFIPEMILVGISNQQNRTRDLTISNITNRQGGAFNQETGGAEKFRQFIENELIPYIDRKYPTTNYRMLIGHSYGGLFVINTLLHHPHLFANYLAIDPSLDWDNQKLIKEAKTILNKKKFENKSLFISLGGPLHMQRNDITIDNIINDKSDYTLFGRSNLEFTKIAKKNKSNGLKTEWKYYKNDFHGTISFPSIRDGLISFFRWYEIKDTHKFNNPETPTKELMKIIKNQEGRYLKHFGYFSPPFDEELLIMSGYMYLDMKQAKKSLAFFNLATKYYPKSANAFDSLSEFYERQKNYSKALENATKAYNISKSEFHLKRMKEFKSKKQKS
jgi:predicted alpha/beta superfamily hydrolase